VTLEFEDGVQACTDLLEVASPHSLRWHSFRLLVSYAGASETNQLLSAVSKCVGSRDLPQLQNLYLNYDFGRGQTWAEMLAAGTTWKGHLYKSWLAPNLDSLSCTGVIPYPLTFARSLTKFDFILVTDLNYQKPRLLISFLANVPTLEELSLFFMCFNPPANSLEISARLPNLRKLSIRITDTNWASMSPIYRALETPRLRDLYLRLQFLKHFNCTLDVTTYLQNLMPDAHTPRLLGLHLNVFVEEDPSRGFVEYAILPLCKYILPHLRHLSLESNLPLLPSPKCPPPLVNIRIINSHHVDIDWFSALRTQMESILAWDDVELVEIRRCNLLLASKQELCSMVSGEKLLI